MYWTRRNFWKEAIRYAKEKGIKYFRISCSTTEGINELLKDILYSLIDNKDVNLIKQIAKDWKEIRRLNRFNIREKFDFFLNKYYIY